MIKASLKVLFSTLVYSGVISVPASACTLWSTPPTDRYSQYRAYTGDRVKILIDPRTSISLIEPYFKEGVSPQHTSRLKSNRNFYHAEGIVWRDVGFRVTETLSGQAQILDAVSYPFKKDATKAEVNKGRTTIDFGFLETLQFRFPTTQLAGSTDSCGHVDFENKLIPGQSYIYINHGYYEFAFPVEGREDPVVEAFKHLSAGNYPWPLRMSPKQYFNNMVDYTHIKIKKCPKHSELYDDPGYLLRKKPKKPKYADPLKHTRELMRVLDTTHIKQPSIDFRDIRASEVTARKHGARNCEIGQEIIVYTRQDLPGYGKAPRNRFANINEGYIARSDVELFTNIELTGPAKISISDLKAWIREANSQEANVDP